MGRLRLGEPSSHVPSLRLVIHERLGHWARHMKPRLSGWPIDWAETRSPADLEDALRSTACPIVLIDAAGRPSNALEDLDLAARAAPNALILVLDPAGHEGFAPVARELGATRVLSGGVVPPAVHGLLLRWIRLALRRDEADGWSLPRGAPPEPWAGITTNLLPPSFPSPRPAP